FICASCTDTLLQLAADHAPPRAADPRVIERRTFHCCCRITQHAIIGALKPRRTATTGLEQRMPFVSIRARLIFLAVLLLAIFAVASALLIGQLMRGSRDLSDEARLVSIVRNANSASKHFGDLKYWITDAAKTFLARSQQNADSAKARLDLDLQAIAPVDPAGVAAIGREV